MENVSNLFFFFSLVLERADKQVGGHIKGVNGLAVDRDRSIL